MGPVREGFLEELTPDLSPKGEAGVELIIKAAVGVLTRGATGGRLEVRGLWWGAAGRDGAGQGDLSPGGHGWGGVSPGEPRKDGSRVAPSWIMALREPLLVK